MKLGDALNLPIGRGTLMEVVAADQLLEQEQTLTRQLTGLSEATERELRSLLGSSVPALPRASHPWTLLTEGEHVGWPLIALSAPPALPAGGSAQLAAQLAQARQPLPLTRARQLAFSAPQADAPRWAELVAELTIQQTFQALLEHWGILAAYVGLHPALRTRAKDELAASLTGTENLAPRQLAETALWSALHLLHGGLPRPERAEIAQLARSLRQPALPQGPLPPSETLRQELSAVLPDLSPQTREDAALHFTGAVEGDGDPLTGLCLIRQPGETAYWLRGRREMQLIVCSGPDARLRRLVWERPS